MHICKYYSSSSGGGAEGGDEWDSVLSSFAIPLPLQPPKLHVCTKQHKKHNKKVLENIPYNSNAMIRWHYKLVQQGTEHRVKIIAV